MVEILRSQVGIFQMPRYPFFLLHLFKATLCNDNHFSSFQVRYYSQRNKLEFDYADGIGFTSQNDDKVPIWFVFYIDGKTRIPTPCTRDTCSLASLKL